jgi:hypothetical protein
MDAIEQGNDLLRQVVSMKGIHAERAKEILKAS